MIDRAWKEQDAILKQVGAVLVRQKKHECWRLPDGRLFTRSASPSDVNAGTNALRTLKTMLGLNEIRGEPGERRKRRTTGSPKQPVRFEAVDIAPRTLRSEMERLRAEAQRRRA